MTAAEIAAILIDTNKQHGTKAAVAAAKAMIPATSTIEWRRGGQIDTPDGPAWKAVVLCGGESFKATRAVPNTGITLSVLAGIVEDARQHLAGKGWTLTPPSVPAAPAVKAEPVYCRDCHGVLSPFDLEAAAVYGYHFDCA